MKFFYCVLLVLMCSSCVSYKIGNYKVQGEYDDNDRIPCLSLKIIEGNFETFYAGRVARLCKKSDDILNEEILNTYIWPTEFKMGCMFDYYTENLKSSFKNTYHKNHSWNKYELLFEKLDKPKFKEYFRIDDGYLAKEEHFQRRLTEENRIIELNKNQISDSAQYMKDYLTKVIKQCPSCFDDGKIIYSGYNSPYLGEYPIPTDYEKGTLPLLISDIKDIYEFEMKYNVCNEDKIRGYCVLKLLIDSVTLNYGIWTNWKMVFLPYTGLPIIKYERSLKIELDVYSFDNVKIKSYTAIGYSKEHSAVYWGYSVKGQAHPNNSGDLCRASNSSAFYDAFQKIKKAIYDDAEFIRYSLTADNANSDL